MNIPAISILGIRLSKRRWNAIQAELEAFCQEHNLISYKLAPYRYQFDGWGLVWFRLACNVGYYDAINKFHRIEGHRFTGKGFESA